MFWSIWCVLVFLSVICRLLDSLQEKNAFGIYSEARWTEQWTEWSIDRTEPQIDRSGPCGSTDPRFQPQIDRSGICGSTDLRRYGLHTHKRAFHSFLPTPLNNSQKELDLGDSEKTRGRPRRRFTSSRERFECFVLVLVWFVKICKGVHLKTIWRRSSEPLLCFNTILSCFLHQNRFVLA